MSECTDKNCPGCKMERLIADFRAEGWPPELVIECFFDYLREAYAAEAAFDVNVENDSPQHLH